MVHLFITPIPQRDSNGRHPRRDYLEQVTRAANGHAWMWDGPATRLPQPVEGDYFMFHYRRGGVQVHKINEVSDSQNRLPSWSDNVGHGDRQVLTLSPVLIIIPWDEYRATYGGEDICRSTHRVRRRPEALINYVRNH